jgi:hypothetical protein
MPDIADPQEPAGSATAEDADQPLFQRHQRARRVAEQSWPEFFRELLLTTLLVIGGIAVLALVLRAIYRI